MEIQGELCSLFLLITGEGGYRNGLKAQDGTFTAVEGDT